MGDVKGISSIKSILEVDGETDAEVFKNYAQGLVDEYTETYKSIKKYGGFYIGRFQLTGSIENPVMKKGEVLISIWYNMKKACTNVVSTTYAQTTMIYGNQWDEVCSWLKTKGYNTDTDSRSWGNYINSTGAADIDKPGLVVTGYSKAWSAQNIYDLAGNYMEWTQETYGEGNRVLRSGFSTSSGISEPCAYRGNYNPVANYNAASRPTLYIK